MIIHQIKFEKTTLWPNDPISKSIRIELTVDEGKRLVLQKVTLDPEFEHLTLARMFRKLADELETR